MTDTPASMLLEQIKEIEAEITKLGKLLEDGELYKIPVIVYHTPVEVPGFEELLKQQRDFQPKLMAYLKRRFSERCAEEGVRRNKFLSRYRSWHKKLRTLEARDPPPPAPAPLVPEPVIPSASSASLSGRGARRGTSDVVRSEAELNQVLLSLLEQERDNPATRWMATLAVTPSMLAADSKSIFQDVFIDQNGRLPQDVYMNNEKPKPDDESIPDSVVHFSGNVVWTEAEQKVFIDKFLAFPKNFRKVASYLPFKRTADCVAFYYKNKKRLRLKQLRKMAASEANVSRIRIPKRPNGPGRPPKKPKKQNRITKGHSLAVSSMEEESTEDFSSTAASLLSLSALIAPNSPTETLREGHNEGNDQDDGHLERGV